MPAVGAGPDSLRWRVAGVPIAAINHLGTLPGVSVVAAAGLNGRGRGRLRIAAGSLFWRAPASSQYGAPAGVSGLADGDELLLTDGADPSKWIRVAVYPAFLSPTAETGIFLDDLFGNGVGPPDVTAADALAGSVPTWELELENVAASPVTAIRAYLAPGIAGVELSADASAWSAPATDAAGVGLGALNPGDVATLYARTTIDAMTPADPRVLAAVRASFDAI